MAMASGSGWSKRWLATPVAAYAFVFVLLGGAGFALWAMEGGSLPWAPETQPVSASKATRLELSSLGRGLDLPPRTTGPQATAPTELKVTPQPAVPVPPQAEAGENDTAALSTKAPEPTTSISQCSVDPGLWPSDRTSQIKIIQLLLRDLGFYGGTTYGTMGPATRAAIAKFQLAANEAETGEPNEMLFEALKKKCAPVSP